MDLAARGQTTLANAPALHLPPIELWCRKFNRGQLDVPGLLTAEYANGNSGCLPAALDHGKQRSADKLAAEEGIVIRKNGRVGDGMKLRQTGVALVHNASRIDDHQLPEDRGPRRQCGGSLQYVVERQIVGPGKFNAVCEGLRLSAYLFQPEFFNGRGTDHYRYIFCVRQYAQDILDGGKIVDPNRDNRVIRGKNGITNPTLFDRGKHHGRSGKELLPMPLNKGSRGRSDAHNQVQRPLGMESAQVLNERDLRIFITGTGSDKRMIRDVQWPW